MRRKALVASVKAGDTDRRILPLNEPRCVGRDCADRSTCLRYTRLVYENLTTNAWKGLAVMMTLQDVNGVCRRKIDA